jgi:hypothetical protein
MNNEKCSIRSCRGKRCLQWMGFNICESHWTTLSRAELIELLSPEIKDEFERQVQRELQTELIK